MASRSTKPGLAIDVELEQESYPAGTDPLCRGVVRFCVPSGSPLLRVRPRTHLCLVLDISGSMDEPGKYPMLLEAVRLLCLGLEEGQRLTIIAFSSEAECIASAIDRKVAARDPDQIVSGLEHSPFRFGGTRLAPALHIALDEIVRCQSRWPGLVQRLYVLTDGQLDDAVECLRFTPYLLERRVEFGSYGFGDDFALETMRSIIGSCAGGGVKRVGSGAVLKETFRHVASLGQRVVSPSAEVELVFEPDVIAGDLFLHRPVARWLPRNLEERTSIIPVGPLEAQRSYVLAFEARVPALRKPLASLGRVRVRYEANGRTATEEASILVNFEPGASGAVKQAVRDVLDDVTSLRDQDPESLLRSYRARLAIFRREYRDPETIKTLEQAIQVLERTGSLETMQEAERREVQVDLNTITAFDLHTQKDEDRDEDPFRPPRKPRAKN